MDTQDAATTSYAIEEAGRGGGGKLRKPPSRRPSSTPYARPPSSSRGGRWLSRLVVDPARRLITSGASRLLPSFFSKSDSNADDMPPLITDDNDKSLPEAEKDTSPKDQNHTLMAGISGLAEENSCGGNRLMGNSDSHRQDKREGPNDEFGISDIEKLMEGKKFSRDEIKRLLDIINSRASDLPSTEQRKMHGSVISGGKTRGHSDLHETPRKVLEEYKQDTKTGLEETWTPYKSSTNKLPDKIGASPIDIAKAYMESRATDVGVSSRSQMATEEQASLHGDDLALKPNFPSPLSNSAICWPGSMGKEQHGSVTPRSARCRLGIQRFPRTPYSRTTYSNSMSKFPQLQGDSSRPWNGTSTRLQQSQASAYQQMELDDRNGSAGPIRRTRHRFAAERSSSGSLYFKSSLPGSPHMNSNTADDLMPVERNLKTGLTERASHSLSTVGKSHAPEASVPTVPPRSSHIARKILEHLERNPPTPRYKSAELKAATEWSKSSSSNVDTVERTEGNSLLHLRGFGSHKTGNSGKLEDRHAFFKAQGEGNSGEVADAIKNKDTSASGIVAEESVKVPPKDFSFQKPSVKEDLSRGFPNAAGTSEISDQQTKFPPHSSGAKPILPSISITKAAPTWALSSDSTSGFTFPVSASTSVSSEPPTPSIMPLPSNSGLHQPNANLDVPIYTFGSKRSSPPLVFSFPSSSDATAAPDDSTELKFNFGSDTKTRLNFGSTGKGEVCC